MQIDNFLYHRPSASAPTSLLTLGVRRWCRSAWLHVPTKAKSVPMARASKVKKNGKMLWNPDRFTGAPLISCCSRKTDLAANSLIAAAISAAMTMTALLPRGIAAALLSLATLNTALRYMLVKPEKHFASIVVLSKLAKLRWTTAS